MCLRACIGCVLCLNLACPVQPKLSLITRTVMAAWTDLVHLFWLSCLVLLAFVLLGKEGSHLCVCVAGGCFETRNSILEHQLQHHRKLKPKLNLNLR